jgi:preprotein translocase subunit SecF
MFVVKYKNLFFILSGTLIVISILAMIFFGFNFGIDFKGGTLTQVTFPSGPSGQGRPSQDQIQNAITGLKLPNFSDTVVQPSGSTDYIIRSRQLTNDEKNEFLSALDNNGAISMTVDSYNSVGPTVGNELKNKAYTAIAVVIICIVLFVTFAFRKVSEPVPSWKYGLATIIALAHDVIIPTGVFLIYIHFTGGQTDILFVSALLAILGYSVHDTIVVFDRIREHLRNNKEAGGRLIKGKNLNANQNMKNQNMKGPNVKGVNVIVSTANPGEPFGETVGKSVSETFGRSINTSLTIFLVLLVLVLIGSSTTRDFTMVLLIGVIVGTYSSIFVASPLLVVFEKWQGKT